MKPLKENPNSVEINGIQSSVKFGIKSTGLHHVLGILRDQLYSNKEQAVVREYSTNAYDAHVQAGIADRPIEVTIPNSLNLHFKVRDFGPALSDEEIHNVYAFYGESSKRNTNEQTGMLGIGSKSAFAYGDNFVINSYLDGTKHIYNAYIDPSQVGQISKLGTEKTDEENGLEIVVPVRREDVDAFQHEARQLFQWFKVTPTIKGAEQFEYEKKKVLLEGDNWSVLDLNTDRYSYRSRAATAVMGNIGYPIELNELNLNEEDSEKFDDLVSDCLILHFDIGELEISASREKLQFTDRTRKVILDRLNTVADEIAEKVGKKFENCDTLFAAQALYDSIFDYGNPLYGLRRVLLDYIKFNGKAVNETYFSVDDDNEGVKLHHLEKPRRGFKMRLTDAWRLDCKENVVVVENDISKTSRGLLGRVLGLSIDDEKDVYVITFDSKKARAAYVKATGFDAPTVLASHLEKKAISHYYPSSGSGSTTTSSGKRIVSKVFKFKPEGWESRASGYWEAANVDLDSECGFYVILDRFAVTTDNGSIDPHRLQQVGREWEKVFKMPMPPIYGVRVKDAALMTDNSNWADFRMYFCEREKAFFKDADVASQLTREKRDEVIRRFIELRLSVLENVAKNVKSKDSDLKKLLDWGNESNDKDVPLDNVRYIHNMLKIAMPFEEIADSEAGVDDSALKQMAQQVSKKYPVLALVDSWKIRDGQWDNDGDAECVKDLAAYVDLVDLASVL